MRMISFHAPRSAASAAACVMCVPKLGCPLCWPLLAGLCSVLGVPFHYVDAALLTLALSALVGCLAVIARRRGRGCGPLLLAAASLLLIVMFRAFDLAVPVNYAGSLGLAASTAWYVMRAQHKGFTRARTTAATCSVVAPESSCFAPLRRT